MKRVTGIGGIFFKAKDAPALQAWYTRHLGSEVQGWGGTAFMVNYRVEDLLVLVKVLREEGCNVLEKIDDSEYGKFAWVIDPEGNEGELWQPPAGQ